MTLDARIPEGPLEQKWERCLQGLKLISPNNKRKYKVLVVGTGLAGASAAATMAELGYRVESFTFHDSPRRAHSVAAQGGINAAKNYRGDGDSIHRLFHDTIKGGDFRSREANVYRLAQVSNQIIDQCVAQGVPFAREYGGLLDNRSFGGALVSRTFYARGQTGQQLLMGAYGALNRQLQRGQVRLHTRTEMVDLIVEAGVARGIVTRNLLTGEIRAHHGDAVVLATGGYSNVFYLSTNAATCNVTASYRAYKRGALFANPAFTQIHPTCIPMTHQGQSKLTLMSESLRNHGRIWVPKQPHEQRPPEQIPEAERDYFLERMYPAYGNLSPRDISSRAVKSVCDEGRGVGAMGRSVYLDFGEAIERLGMDNIAEHYGNLFEMYQHISDENPYQTPMRIYPAAHYTMGGLWVDYHLMSNLPGLFAIGEANFSDHGANRLGASALMQGLADGYFILPQTIGDYLADKPPSEGQERVSADAVVAASRAQTDALLALDGERSIRSLHRELGEILWNHCGMSRTEAGLNEALEQLAELKRQFWHNGYVGGSGAQLNQELEWAGRVADFIEFGELMCRDALQRKESCGAHFREEYQQQGEAARDDARYAHVTAWQHRGEAPPQELREPLQFESIEAGQRSYQ